MSLDEDQLGPAPHLGRAREDVRDVAGLVACRHDHGHARQRARRPRDRLRAGHHEIASAPAPSRARCEPDSDSPNWPAPASASGTGFPSQRRIDLQAREMQEVRHVGTVSQFCVQEWAAPGRAAGPAISGRFPQAAVEVEDHARARGGQARHLSRSTACTSHRSLTRSERMMTSKGSASAELVRVGLNEAKARGCRRARRLTISLGEVQAHADAGRARQAGRRCRSRARARAGPAGRGSGRLRPAARDSADRSGWPRTCAGRPRPSARCGRLGTVRPHGRRPVASRARDSPRSASSRNRSPSDEFHRAVLPSGAHRHTMTRQSASSKSSP